MTINEAENNDQDFTDMMNEAASMAESENSDFDFASEDQQTQTQEQEVVPAPPENDPEPVQVPSRDKVMPQEQDEIAHTARVIRVLDSWRDLSEDEQDVAINLISNTGVENENEAVVSILHVKPMLGRSIKALTEAKDLDAVERAFYIMRLDRSLAKNLAALVMVFDNEGSESVSSLDSIDLARVLVDKIETLSSHNMNYINATQSLINASEGVQEDK